MKKLHFSIHINAPQEKVWHATFDKVPYGEWTSIFGPGGSFTGDWSQGSKMVFLGPNPDNGKMGGMVGEIAENRPNEFLSIRHVGIVTDGVEDTESAEARKWTPAFENYTFHEKDGGTDMFVDTDTEDSMVAMFNEKWPKALEKLKEIAERS